MNSSILKVVIFGDAGCGKTTLAKRFMSNVFISTNKMTIGVEFHYKTIKVDEEYAKLMIWDFAGEERFRFAFPHYIVGARGGILMYDITNESSFLHMSNWLSVVHKAKNQFPIILMGAKSDLDSSRVIDYYQGEEMAKLMNLKSFLECSSKTGENVEHSFQKLTRMMLNGACSTDTIQLSE
jgi:Ras-related protein Rab-1A